MSQQDRNKRRALIARRWAAYRTGRAQREIWRRRREAQAEESDEVSFDDDPIVELPEALLG